MRLPKERSVWILDADEEGRDQVVRSCLQYGMPAVGHRSPEEHFATLSHAVPLCVVIDYRAGSEDGLSVIERTRELTWPLPAILMAKDLDVPLVTRAFRSGCLTVLAKPLDASQLRIEVRDAIRVGSKALAEFERRLEAKSRFADLTPNQRLVLREMLLGARNKSIAERLGISLRTVDNRKHEIFEALGVQNLVGLYEVARLVGIEQLGYETPAAGTHSADDQGVWGVPAMAPSTLAFAPLGNACRHCVML